MEIVTCTENGATREHRDYVPFGTAHLAEMATEHGGDIPLRIASHGETYEIGSFGYDPHEHVITLSSGCPHDIPFQALSYDGNPVATAQFHHQEAEKLARHLEEVAAGIRTKYPAPDAPPEGCSAVASAGDVTS